MPGLSHQAFLYDSPEHFATAMAPLVRAGVERGDQVAVVAKQACNEALCEKLGGAIAGVQMHDTLVWHPRPVQRLMAIQRVVAAMRPGTRLLALGEPVWSGSPAERREWARFESAINVALADAPLHFVCLYDRSELPDEVLDYGCATHPELVGVEAVHPSEGFQAPAEFVRTLDASAPPPAADHYDIAFGGDYHAFRGLLRGLAVECGVDADRAEELMLAANEVVTNAVHHGEPPVSARCWVADGDFVCEVADGGGGVPDPLAGWDAPPSGSADGWGLAVTRRVCDALEVGGGPSGSRVRLYVSLAD